MSETEQITGNAARRKCYIWMIGSNTHVLLRKNFILLARNKTATLIQLALPFIFCFYLTMLQSLIDNFVQTTAVHSPSIYESYIPRCTGEDCISLEVVISGDSADWTDFVIPHISQQSGLSIGKDIRVSQQSPLSFMESLSANRNKTQVALILCTSQYDLQENIYLDSISCQKSNSTSYFYSIIFNYTTVLNQGYSSFKPHFFSAAAIGVKTAIDNAILAYEQSKQLHGNASISVEVSYSGFPSPVSRYINNFDVTSTQGTLYYFIPPMILFGMIVAEIVREKEQKLRYGLIATGISHKEYWASWFGVAFCLVFAASNIQIFSGYILKIDFFLNTPYVVLLLMFVTFGMSMMMVGFFLATLLPTARSAYTASYAFFLVGFIFQIFFSNLFFIRLFFSEVLPSWANWAVYMMMLYPPFMYSTIADCINAKSSHHYSKSRKLWVEGSGYKWHNFFNPRKGLVVGPGYHYTILSGIATLGIILLDSFLFACLAWYFDHIIEGNRGKKYPLHFPFTKEYWKEKIQNSSLLSLSKTEGLELNGLEKVYSTGFLKKLKKQAVKPLHLTVQNDQLLALIGHNGAGKTTLLSMLTGLLAPTSGTASINGFDLIKDFRSISKIIGYCPQHDILWNELTAREHLEMFCRFKCVANIDFTVEKILKEISLESDADVLVGGFSGGMKRRLSVGIASLGNPKIVFLDEPTTGMDPVSKKKVWRLVKELKQDKVVVLTTHSMEEADILSDNIALMVDGSIKYVGTSLSLKNKFGEGYKINIVSSKPQECWEKVLEMNSHIELIDISAGSLMVSLPRKYPDVIERFLEDMENRRYGELVEEWALSNSSLEEVFMKLTGKKFNID